jgi:hypothetical protein
MKPYIVYVLLALLCPSCDKTIEVMRIIVENDTGKSITIKLFPKSEYLNKSGDSYSFSALGGGHNPTTFELEIDSMEPRVKDLYSTDDLNVSATELAYQVFDSIQIIFKNDQQSTIVFTHEGAKGYARNLFTEDSAWSYELDVHSAPAGLSRIYIFEEHDYTFTFKEEDIE